MLLDFLPAMLLLLAGWLIKHKRVTGSNCSSPISQAGASPNGQKSLTNNYTAQTGAPLCNNPGTQ
jgi:hypothetical protein